MEAIVQPMHWDHFGEGGGIFRALRSPEGERLILDQNAFVETVLPRAIIRTLGDEEMVAYRAPFLEREARLPTLIWPRQIPIDGEPADVTAAVERYGVWLAQSLFPSCSSAATQAPSLPRPAQPELSAGAGRTSARLP